MPKHYYVASKDNIIIDTSLTCSQACPCCFQGHGYLLEPPARGTAWRKGFNTPIDTDDMSNFCGGRGVRSAVE